MWLVTFLLLLDSLHKGEPRAAGREGAAAARNARGWRPGGGARRAPGVPGTDLGAPHPGPGDGASTRTGARRESARTAPPATRACRWGASGGRGWGVGVRHEPLISPLLAGPQFCPGPIPPPRARFLWFGGRWDPGVPSESRGAQAVSVHWEPSLHRGSDAAADAFSAAGRPSAAPDPRAAPLGAHPRLGRTQGGGSWGSASCESRGTGVPRTASLFPQSRGRLPRTPSHPAPRTSPGFAAPP